MNTVRLRWVLGNAAVPATAQQPVAHDPACAAPINAALEKPPTHVVPAQAGTHFDLHGSNMDPRFLRDDEQGPGRSILPAAVAPPPTAPESACSALNRLVGMANILWYLEPTIGSRTNTVTTVGVGKTTIEDLLGDRTAEFHVWAAREWVHGVRRDHEFDLVHWSLCEAGEDSSPNHEIACQQTPLRALVRGDLARFKLEQSLPDGTLRLVEYRAQGRLVTWRMQRAAPSKLPVKAADAQAKLSNPRDKARSS